MTLIARDPTVMELTLRSSLADSVPIPFLDRSSMVVLNPAARVAINATIYVAEERGGPYYEYLDAADVAIGFTCPSGKAKRIGHEDVFPLHWMKLVDAADDTVNKVTLLLKG